MKILPMIAVLVLTISTLSFADELNDTDMREIVELVGKNPLSGEILSVEEIKHIDESGQPTPYRNAMILVRAPGGSHYQFRVSKIDLMWQFDDEERSRVLEKYFGVRGFEGIDELQAAGEALVQEFHLLYNSGRFDSIYNAADPSLREKVDLLRMRTKYGAYVSSFGSGSCGSSNISGTFTQMDFRSKFGSAELIERFYFKLDDDGKPLLYDYKYMVDRPPTIQKMESLDETLTFVDRSGC